MTDVVVGTLAIVGALLVLLAGAGVVRFPDLYSRMHAATKAPTVGIGLISIGGAIAIDGGTAKILLATAIIFITAPAAAHLIGRSAHQAEGIAIPLEGPDDLDEILGGRPKRRGPLDD